MVIQTPAFSRRRLSRAGFTLVEVALAIGIVAFAFVALFALLPAGHTAYRRSIDIAVCGQIAQRVIGDAEEADFDNLIDTVDAQGVTDPPNFTFRGPTRFVHYLRSFDDQGREIVANNNNGTLTAAQQAKVIYQVNTRIMPTFRLPENIGAPPPTGISPTYESMALVTVQVAHNPNHIQLPFSTASESSTDATRNLWFIDSSSHISGIDIFTYSAVVGRAQ
jgi:uncharacterized protein (TIGR02598 family)